MADLDVLLTDSQACWPADSGNYAGLFVRLAWHCSGSYRATDGTGGCTGGRQRFEPEASWEDNINLDKARALLWPIKEKYGMGLSWGDLFTLAGTVAIKHGGGPLQSICFGRVDDADGTLSLPLGPSAVQEEVAPCAEQGRCQRPLGTTTVGLIYLNPEGPLSADGTHQVPDPALSAHEVRDSFNRMGFTDDRTTVALIGGGHAFGKTHGACKLGAGLPPNKDANDPWAGNCGTGMGKDTYTSGFEGPWTTKTSQWGNEFFRWLRDFTWEKWVGPGGKWQWRIKGAVGDEATVMRLTSDMALWFDPKYHVLVEEFAANQTALDQTFAHGWLTLTTNGGTWSQNWFCKPGNVPAPQPASGPRPVVPGSASSPHAAVDSIEI